MKLEPVSSSAIKAVGYDKPSRQMRIQFTTGGDFTYHGVPPERHADLVAAKSIGTHFHKHILGKYRHTKN